MLAHGIRVYHRPSHLADALELLRGGARAMGGGTRLLATAGEVPEVLDLSALPLWQASVDDEDVVLGAGLTLQDAIDEPLVWTHTAGLLPRACLAASPSRMVRAMATLGGESAHAAHDSEVVAALVALNAVFVVQRGTETTEVPALRFVKNHVEDLADGGLITSILIPGVPDGAAIERAAVLPSAPPLLSVAVAVAFAGEHCARARIAFTGLDGPPARILEAEARIEGSSCDPKSIARCLEAVGRAPFRTDAHASGDYRRAIAGALTARALDAAVKRARKPETFGDRRPWPRRPPAPAPAGPPLIGWGGGPVPAQVNGIAHRLEARPDTTLLDALRAAGIFGVKHGCETGECGACTVLLDGMPVVSCLTLAARVHGRSITTVEGLGTPDSLHPVQAAFVDTGAIQCGYCIPAMELVATALIAAVPDPTETEVREALAGCLCRCTGYVKPVQAVLQAAAAMRNGKG